MESFLFQKISIFNASLNRLSIILQEESNIKKMFNVNSLNFLIKNKVKSHQANLTIINTDINFVHQSVQQIFWKIQSEELVSSIEVSFLLKVNTVDNSTLVSVTFTLLNQLEITKEVRDQSLLLVSEIIEHINILLNKDEYYRSQIESIIIAVPRNSIWDYITQWKYANTSHSNCFEVKFINNPGVKGSIIQFVDPNNNPRIYAVTLVDDNPNNSQWLYHLLLKEDQSTIFQQIKFEFTLIENNITLVSMESCFSQNVSFEEFERMKEHKKKMLEGIKNTLEGVNLNVI